MTPSGTGKGRGLGNSASPASTWETPMVIPQRLRPPPTKVPSPSAELKRQTVIHVCQKLHTSERRTCNILGIAHSTMTYHSKDRDEDAIRHDIIRFTKMFGRYGYRKIAKLLRVSGWQVNHKKVERIWREEGFLQRITQLKGVEANGYLIQLECEKSVEKCLTAEFSITLNIFNIIKNTISDKMCTKFIRGKSHDWHISCLIVRIGTLC